jgi:hypothetical protein
MIDKVQSVHRAATENKEFDSVTMPSGWYPDAQGRPVEHYWSGNHWTGETRPAQGMPIPPPPPSQQPPVPPMVPLAGSYPNGAAPQPGFAPRTSQRLWYQRPGVLITGGVVAVLIVIGAVGAGVATSKESQASGPSPAHPVRHSVNDSNGGRAPELVQRTPADGHRHADRSRRDGAAGRAAPAGSFVMPNEIGKDLQSAQDDLQRVSRDPVFVSHSHDLLEDRFQILDSDWQVCTQNVSPGTRVGAFAHIDFGVVKTYETCP